MGLPRVTATRFGLGVVFFCRPRPRVERSIPAAYGRVILMEKSRSPT
jgi:hypothetical protein